MSDANSFLSNSKDTLISDINSSLWGLLKSKIKSTDYYLSATRTIDFDSMNKEFKQLIEDSFHEAMKGLNLEIENQADYRESILGNANILLEWFQKEPYPAFNEDLIEVSNYDIKENIIRLFKSLHYQIQIKRNTCISSVFTRLRDLSNNNFNLIRGDLSNITQILLERLPGIPNQINSDTILNSWKISEPLKKAESFFKNRKYENAKVLLDAIPIESNTITIDEREKYYEIYTNIMLTNHENQANAILYLNKLIENTTNKDKKACRSILALCIEKKYKEALSRISTEIQNNNANKDTLYELEINIFLLNDKLDDANEYIESIKETFSKYFIWKTRILTCLGNYNEAEELINKQEALFSKDFNSQVLLLQTKVFNITDKFSKTGFIPSWKQILPSLISKVKELLEIVHENKQDNETLLISLAFLYRISNETDKLLDIYKQLENLKSKNPNFIRNYPLILVQIGKIKESTKWFEVYIKEYPEDLFILDIYYQILIDINVRDAINGIELLPLNADYLKIKTRLVIAYVKNHEKNKAREFWNTLHTKFPDDLDVMTAQIDFLIDDKKIEEASSLAKHIFINTKDDPAKYIIMHRIIAIDVNYSLSQFYLNDISLLESLHNDYEMLLHFGEQYIGLLLTTNQIQKAYSCIKTIRKYELLTPNIIRNEIFCNFNTQNYQQVLLLFEELQTYENLNSQDNIFYLRACFALGDTKTFKEKIDSISEPNNEYDFSILHNQLFKLGLKEKDIEFAHKGYKKFPKNLKLQENFIDAVLGSTFNSLPEEIQHDAIECRDEYFKINTPNKRYRQYFLPKEPTIDDLLNIINTAYPERKQINYQKIINDSKFHISLLTVNNTNYFDLWESSLHISKIPIYYNDGRESTRKKENISASEKICVIDLPTLISCDFLDILELLPKLFQKVYISWQSIQEVEEILAIENNVYLSNTYSWFYRLNNYHSSTTDISWGKSLKIAKNIKKFANLPCVAIVGKQLSPVIQFPAKYETLKDFLDYESLKFAYESNIPIAVENAHFRALFSSDEDAPSTFCIDSILYRLFSECHISYLKYIKCLCKLLKVGYRWVFINHSIMFFIIEYNGFLESKESNIIFEALSNKEIYAANWTIEQLSILMAKIWNSSIPSNRKEFWSNKIFSVYVKRNDIPLELINMWLIAVYKTIRTNQNKEDFFNYTQNIENDK